MPLFDGRLRNRLAPILSPIFNVGDLLRVVDPTKLPAVWDAVSAVWSNPEPWDTAAGLRSHVAGLKNAGHVIAGATATTVDDDALPTLDMIADTVDRYADTILKLIALVKRLPVANQAAFSALSVESPDFAACGLTAQEVEALGLGLPELLQIAQLIWQLISTIRSQRGAPIGASVFELAAE